MGTIQIPDHLRQTIDRQIAEGRAHSEADYVTTALRAYAEHVEAEKGILAMIDRADADMAEGRFVTVTGTNDADALHVRVLDRLHARMSEDSSER